MHDIFIQQNKGFVLYHSDSQNDYDIVLKASMTIICNIS